MWSENCELSYANNSGTFPYANRVCVCVLNHPKECAVRIYEYRKSESFSRNSNFCLNEDRVKTEVGMLSIWCKQCTVSVYVKASSAYRPACNRFITSVLLKINPSNSFLSLATDRLRIWPPWICNKLAKQSERASEREGQCGEWEMVSETGGTAWNARQFVALM